MVLENLARALWVVERSFSRDGHLMLEFMQNAEDAEARKLKITLERTNEGAYELVICNDGHPFSKDDVDALCSIGRSHKDPQLRLGYLGVGFKSAFLVSDHIKVYSWPYSFEFNKNKCSHPEREPWQIIPLWLENYPDRLWEWNTTFILTLRPDKVQSIVNELETLTSRVLLFTHNLREIILEWNGQSRSFSKFESIIKEEDARQVLRIDIVEKRDGKTERASWLVFRSIIDVPHEVSQDPNTKVWRRDAVRRREISVAFRLDESGNLSRQHGTLKFGLFSYLPLREEVYDLPFIIQGDFLTGPGREAMHREAKWNIWLLKEIRKFIVEYIIPEFKQNPLWKFTYTSVLYGNAPHIIDIYLAKPLREEILNGAHFLDLNEEFVKCKDVIYVNEKIMKLGHDFIQKLTRKRILHPKFVESISSNFELKSKIESYGSVSAFVEKYGEHTYLQAIFGDNWVTCLKKLLEALADEWFEYSEGTRKNYRYINKYNSVVTVLSTRGETCVTNEIKLATDELEKLAEEIVPGAFKFLHPELRTDKIIRFLKELRAWWLTREDIEREYSKSRAPELIKELLDELLDASTSDDRRVEIVKQLFRLRSHGFIPSEKLKGIPVKTKTGKWLSPETVVFSSEYQPEYRLEELIARGFLDAELEFLDPVFIKDATIEEVSKWRVFFIEIGLGKKFKLENFVERVGILLSLEYEKENRCEAVELTESEAKGAGYDIRSVRPDGSIKYIEVKSTRLEEKDLDFTEAEYRRLMKEPENYFVYVVTDALAHPKLYVLSGKELRELLLNRTAKVILSYSDWKAIAPEPSWKPMK